MAWNRENGGGPDSSEDALGWSLVAMRETTARLLCEPTVDRRQGFSVISEAVWWVTMVDATLVRYHPDIYGAVLARSEPAEQRAIEDTFGGLRFVRNQMGYEADHHDFIQPQPSDSGRHDRGFIVAAWTWKPVAEPSVASLSARGRDWEMARYRAYQAQLAGHTVGDTFTRARGFLQLACEP